MGSNANFSTSHNVRDSNDARSRDENDDCTPPDPVVSIRRGTPDVGGPAG